MLTMPNLVLTFLAVELSPIPVHVVLLVQDFEHLALPKRELVVGGRIEVVLGHGFHDVFVSLRSLLDKCCYLLPPWRMAKPNLRAQITKESSSTHRFLRLLAKSTTTPAHGALSLRASGFQEFLFVYAIDSALISRLSILGAAG